MIKFSRSEPKNLQDARVAYYLKYYNLVDVIASQESQSEAAMGGLSLSQVGCQAKIEQGDHYYEAKQIDLALSCYLSSLRSHVFLSQGLFKIGLCIEKGIESRTILENNPIYQRHKGHTLSQFDLAAVFFREVLRMDPFFKDTDSLANPHDLSPYFSLAIYQLGICISKGALILPEDLLSTPFEFEGERVERVNPIALSNSLYQRAIRLEPNYCLVEKAFLRRLKMIEGDYSPGEGCGTPFASEEVPPLSFPKQEDKHSRQLK